MPLAERAKTMQERSLELVEDHLAAGAARPSNTGSGSAFHAGRYHEGRAFVAAQVLRALHRGLSDADAVAAAGQRWQRMTGRSRSGEEWAAYRSGGDDALRDLGG